MEHEHDKFKVGEHVIVNVKGYRPWPAKITSIGIPNKKYNVYFFGSKEFSTCKSEEIVPYYEHNETLKRDSGGQYYKEGIIELEEDLIKNPGLSNRKKGLKRKLQAGTRVTADKRAQGKKKQNLRSSKDSKEEDSQDENSQDEYSDGEYSKEEDSEDDFLSLDEVLEEDCSPGKEIQNEDLQGKVSRSGRKIKQRKLDDL